jgi:hypothetical protein
VSVEAVGERHWRLVWGGNALEVRLTGGSLAHVDGPATL